MYIDIDIGGVFEERLTHRLVGEEVGAVGPTDLGRGARRRRRDHHHILSTHDSIRGREGG